VGVVEETNVQNRLGGEVPIILAEIVVGGDHGGGVKVVLGTVMLSYNNNNHHGVQVAILVKRLHHVIHLVGRLLANIEVRVVIQQHLLEIIEGGARVKVEQNCKMMIQNLSSRQEVYPSLGALPEDAMQEAFTVAAVVLLQWVLVVE
jgi:hypothetical protein